MRNIGIESLVNKELRVQKLCSVEVINVFTKIEHGIFLMLTVPRMFLIFYGLSEGCLTAVTSDSGNYFRKVGGYDKKSRY